MYKKNSDQSNFISRTGSHATKESRTGRIDAIPAWAEEPEAYYNSLRDRWRSILEQLIETQNQLAEINRKLKYSMPFKEYEHLRQHKERLSDKVALLQQEQGEYRPLARAAGERAWATIFFFVARKLLPPDDFLILIKETKALLGGRPEVEISKGEGEKSEEQKIKLREHEHRRRRRVNWNQHKTGAVTVWADNKPVQQKYIDEIRTKNDGE